MVWHGKLKERKKKKERKKLHSSETACIFLAARGQSISDSIWKM